MWYRQTYQSRVVLDIYLAGNPAYHWYRNTIFNCNTTRVSSYVHLYVRQSVICHKVYQEFKKCCIFLLIWNCRISGRILFISGIRSDTENVRISDTTLIGRSKNHSNDEKKLLLLMLKKNFINVFQS